MARVPLQEREARPSKEHLIGSVAGAVAGWTRILLVGVVPPGVVSGQFVAPKRALARAPSAFVLVAVVVLEVVRRFGFRWAAHAAPAPAKYASSAALIRLLDVRPRYHFQCSGLAFQPGWAASPHAGHSIACRRCPRKQNGSALMRFRP